MGAGISSAAKRAVNAVVAQPVRRLLQQYIRSDVAVDLFAAGGVALDNAELRPDALNTKLAAVLDARGTLPVVVERGDVRHLALSLSELSVALRGLTLCAALIDPRSVQPPGPVPAASPAAPAEAKAAEAKAESDGMGDVSMLGSLIEPHMQNYEDYFADSAGPQKDGAGSADGGGEDLGAELADAVKKIQVRIEDISVVVRDSVSGSLVTVAIASLSSVYDEARRARCVALGGVTVSLADTRDDSRCTILSLTHNNAQRRAEVFLAEGPGSLSLTSDMTSSLLDVSLDTKHVPLLLSMVSTCVSCLASGGDESGDTLTQTQQTAAATSAATTSATTIEDVEASVMRVCAADSAWRPSAPSGNTQLQVRLEFGQASLGLRDARVSREQTLRATLRGLSVAYEKSRAACKASAALKQLLVGEEHEVVQAGRRSFAQTLFLWNEKDPFSVTADLGTRQQRVAVALPPLRALVDKYLIDVLMSVYSALPPPQPQQQQQEEQPKQQPKQKTTEDSKKAPTMLFVEVPCVKLSVTASLGLGRTAPWSPYRYFAEDEACSLRVECNKLAARVGADGADTHLSVQFADAKAYLTRRGTTKLLLAVRQAHNRVPTVDVILTPVRDPIPPVALIPPAGTRPATTMKATILEASELLASQNVVPPSSASSSSSATAARDTQQGAAGMTGAERLAEQSRRGGGGGSGGGGHGRTRFLDRFAQSGMNALFGAPFLSYCTVPGMRGRDVHRFDWMTNYGRSEVQLSVVLPQLDADVAHDELCLASALGALFPAGEGTLSLLFNADFNVVLRDEREPATVWVEFAAADFAAVLISGFSCGGCAFRGAPRGLVLSANADAFACTGVGFLRDPVVFLRMRTAKDAALYTPGLPPLTVLTGELKISYRDSKFMVRSLVWTPSSPVLSFMSRATTTTPDDEGDAEGAAAQAAETKKETQEAGTAAKETGAASEGAASEGPTTSSNNKGKIPRYELMLKHAVAYLRTNTAGVESVVALSLHQLYVSALMPESAPMTVRPLVQSVQGFHRSGKGTLDLIAHSRAPEPAALARCLQAGNAFAPFLALAVPPRAAGAFTHASGLVSVVECVATVGARSTCATADFHRARLALTLTPEVAAALAALAAHAEDVTDLLFGPAPAPTVDLAQHVLPDYADRAAAPERRATKAVFVLDQTADVEAAGGDDAQVAEHLPCSLSDAIHTVEYDPQRDNNRSDGGDGDDDSDDEDEEEEDNNGKGVGPQEGESAFMKTCIEEEEEEPSLSVAVRGLVVAVTVHFAAHAVYKPEEQVSAVVTLDEVAYQVLPPTLPDAAQPPFALHVRVADAVVTCDIEHSSWKTVFHRDLARLQRWHDQENARKDNHPGSLSSPRSATKANGATGATTTSTTTATTTTTTTTDDDYEQDESSSQIGELSSGFFKPEGALLSVDVSSRNFTRQSLALAVRARVQPFKVYVTQRVLAFLFDFKRTAFPASQRARGAVARQPTLRVPAEALFDEVRVAPVKLTFSYRTQAGAPVPVWETESDYKWVFMLVPSVKESETHLARFSFRAPRARPAPAAVVADRALTAYYPSGRNIADLAGSLGPVQLLVRFCKNTARIVHARRDDVPDESEPALAGLARGLNTVAVETINLGSHSFFAVVRLLHWADRAVAGADTDAQRITTLADTPQTVAEGLQSAGRALVGGFTTALDGVTKLPLHAFHNSGFLAGISTFVRNVPGVVLRPVVGASDALLKVLFSVRNTMDPSIRIREINPFLLPSDPQQGDAPPSPNTQQNKDTSGSFLGDTTTTSTAKQ